MSRFNIIETFRADNGVMVRLERLASYSLFKPFFNETSKRVIFDVFYPKHGDRHLISNLKFRCANGVTMDELKQIKKLIKKAIH